MSQTPNELLPSDKESWKTRVYLSGASLGMIVGLLSAYLFARSAEENTTKKPPQIPTTQLIGALLALLGLIRQLAELGKEKKK